MGGIDVLVNNAGISPRGTVESTDEALWDRTLGDQPQGGWLGIKAALPSLAARRGTIVNIGSTRATRPMPGLFSYVVSKAGPAGPDPAGGGRVPERRGDMQHGRPGMGRHARRAADPGPATAGPIFPTGIRNLTTPEEIGAAVVYLASRAGRKINGVILYLDPACTIADDAGMVYLPDRSRRTSTYRTA